MFVPWSWVSRSISDKPVITERATLFSDDNVPGIKEIKFIYTILELFRFKSVRTNAVRRDCFRQSSP